VISDPRETGTATRRVLDDPSFAAAARALAAQIAELPTPADVIATLVTQRTAARSVR
jgi:UDP:flavonoid glycosyltransferase YjiC (YdhE family)